MHKPTDLMHAAVQRRQKGDANMFPCLILCLVCSRQHPPSLIIAMICRDHLFAASSSSLCGGIASNESGGEPVSGSKVRLNHFCSAALFRVCVYFFSSCILWPIIRLLVSSSQRSGSKEVTVAVGETAGKVKDQEHGKNEWRDERYRRGRSS